MSPWSQWTSLLSPHPDPRRFSSLRSAPPSWPSSATSSLRSMPSFMSSRSSSSGKLRKARPSPSHELEPPSPSSAASRSSHLRSPISLRTFDDPAGDYDQDKDRPGGLVAKQQFAVSVPAISSSRHHPLPRSRVLPAISTTTTTTTTTDPKNFLHPSVPTIITTPSSPLSARHSNGSLNLPKPNPDPHHQPWLQFQYNAAPKKSASTSTLASTTTSASVATPRPSRKLTKKRSNHPRIDEQILEANELLVVGVPPVPEIQIEHVPSSSEAARRFALSASMSANASADGTPTSSSTVLPAVPQEEEVEVPPPLSPTHTPPEPYPQPEHEIHTEIPSSSSSSALPLVQPQSHSQPEPPTSPVLLSPTSPTFPTHDPTDPSHDHDPEDALSEDHSTYPHEIQSDIGHGGSTRGVGNVRGYGYVRSEGGHGDVSASPVQRGRPAVGSSDGMNRMSSGQSPATARLQTHFETLPHHHPPALPHPHPHTQPHPHPQPPPTPTPKRASLLRNFSLSVSRSATGANPTASTSTLTSNAAASTSAISGGVGPSGGGAKLGPFYRSKTFRRGRRSNDGGAGVQGKKESSVLDRPPPSSWADVASPLPSSADSSSASGHGYAYGYASTSGHGSASGHASGYYTTTSTSSADVTTGGSASDLSSTFARWRRWRRSGRRSSAGGASGTPAGGVSGVVSAYSSRTSLGEEGLVGEFGRRVEKRVGLPQDIPQPGRPSISETETPPSGLGLDETPSPPPSDVAGSGEPTTALVQTVSPSAPQPQSQIQHPIPHPPPVPVVPAKYNERPLPPTPKVKEHKKSSSWTDTAFALLRGFTSKEPSASASGSGSGSGSNMGQTTRDASTSSALTRPPPPPHSKSASDTAAAKRPRVNVHPNTSTVSIAVVNGRRVLTKERSRERGAKSRSRRGSVDLGRDEGVDGTYGRKKGKAKFMIGSDMEDGGAPLPGLLMSKEHGNGSRSSVVSNVIGLGLGTGSASGSTSALTPPSLNFGSGGGSSTDTLSAPPRPPLVRRDALISEEAHVGRRRWTLANAMTDEGISDAGLVRELERMREVAEWARRRERMQEVGGGMYMRGGSTASALGEGGEASSAMQVDEDWDGWDEWDVGREILEGGDVLEMERQKERERMRRARKTVAVREMDEMEEGKPPLTDSPSSEDGPGPGPMGPPAPVPVHANSAPAAIPGVAGAGSSTTKLPLVVSSTITNNARSLSSPSPSWLTAQRALLTCRELILTERHYLTLISALVQQETVSPPPPLMRHYAAELLRASQGMLKGMEREPSARGVARAFLDREEEVEGAYVRWCGVVGGWFVGDGLSVAAVAGSASRSNVNDGEATPVMTAAKRRRAAARTMDGETAGASGSSGAVVTAGPPADGEDPPSSPLKRTVSTWRKSMPSIPSLGLDGGSIYSGSVRRREKLLEKDEGEEEEKKDKPVKRPAVRDLAILPTQRVMRYVLLYRDLLSHTPPTSPSRALVERAVDAACRIADKCDRAQGNSAFIVSGSSAAPAPNSRSSSRKGSARPASTIAPSPPPLPQPPSTQTSTGSTSSSSQGSNTTATTTTTSNSTLTASSLLSSPTAGKTGARSRPASPTQNSRRMSTTAVSSFMGWGKGGGKGISLGSAGENVKAAAPP